MSETKIINKNVLTLEELSLNSWPALREIHYHGWIIRLANEFSRRSNSVWPLYGSSNDLEKKVQKCESVYRAHNQRSLFRITSDESMSGLDKLLEGLGYARVTTVVVQTLDISNFQDDSDNSEITLSNKLTDSWSDGVAKFAGLGDGRPAYHAILKNITFPIGLVSVRSGSALIGVAFCVLEKPYLALYGMQTHPSHRRKGYARKMMGSMLSWGVRNGATTAFLHVEQDNVPARTLYDDIGFTGVYNYWYRALDWN